jgi:hypothetical protein
MHSNDRSLRDRGMLVLFIAVNRISFAGPLFGARGGDHPASGIGARHADR